VQITPTVAIVGRPNVGKSSLFNRLVGRRRSIVHDLPGVTRDRIVALARLDTEHTVQLVDTGGLVPGDDPLGLGRQVIAALADSDLVVVVVDGSEGLVPGDELVVAEVRRLGKPWVLAVNKGDTVGPINRNSIGSGSSPSSPPSTVAGLASRSRDGSAAPTTEARRVLSSGVGGRRAAE
jgi:small GTP-binding protein